MWGKRKWVAAGLTLLILAVGISWAVNQYQREVEKINAEMTQQAAALGNNLYQVMQEGMMNNDHARVRHVVASQVGNGVVRARILGLNGKVYADSGGQLPGVFIAKEMPGCVECHRHTPLPENTTLKFLPNHIRVAIPIANDTTCASCHNIPGAVSLGVILVDVSLVGREAEAWQEMCLQLVGVTAVALAVGWGIVGFPGLRWRPTNLYSLIQPALLRVNWAVATVLGGVTLLLLTSGFVVTRVEGNNQFCASCHTEPETTYYQRTLTQPVDLASAHAGEGVVCVQCHSGAGITGRAETLVLAAQNAVLFYTNQYHSPGTAETAIHTDHCLKCHNEITSQFNPATHFHYFVPQWGQETACVACHQGHVVAGSLEMGFTDNNQMEPVCQACHQAAQ